MELVCIKYTNNHCELVIILLLSPAPPHMHLSSKVKMLFYFSSQEPFLVYRVGRDKMTL